MTLADAFIQNDLQMIFLKMSVKNLPAELKTHSLIVWFSVLL